MLKQALKNPALRKRARQFGRLIRHSAVTPRMGESHKPKLVSNGQMGVTFIGHAVMFWSYIDKNVVPKVGYPKGKVSPGGLTDRYLSDFPNLYADMSAGSGLNALIRDEDHARAFIARHQDRMLFGSDCADVAGVSPICTGANLISAIRRLSPSKAVERKLLYENARALFAL